MLTFKYFQDPGHGWFAVPVSLVRELGIASKISAYSYVSRDGETLYIEEDGDALRFHDAMKKKGREYKLEESHTNSDSFIRRLASWRTIAPLFDAEDMPPVPVRVGQSLDLF